ncbi:glutathione S-transferase omega-1 [Solea senegalensis]|uniref:Glutathione-dependent dehydroascorbate reductase n=1 Tax=Solea senegalensis TaxID=28829 RepID=A0AAV6S7J7_SOLSE|nr:glutathione S-transferase omega-1-like [Solea senegalensis]KAG7513169.1 glutathione S-transferase omega-1 [Solea senegalensis]
MATEKVFAKGSAAPGPVMKDSIRIYSMRFCPFAQRTRLVLNAKGIKHETININLKDKPEWFLAKNPLGLVPTLETSAGEVIYESPITCDYLDEVYPEKKLLPSSPYEKAQQKMMLEHFSKVVPYLYTIPLGRRKGEDVSRLEAELKEKLAKFDQDLVDKKTKFFGGNSITMIDYMMYPFMERMAVAEIQYCLDHTPALKKWMQHMSEDPTVKETTFDVDTYKNFYKSYHEGKPDYDYGL